MAGPLDDIQKLLDAMRGRAEEMDAFRTLLTSIGQSLADIVALMEADAADDGAKGQDKIAALVAAIEKLQIPSPAVQVTVQQTEPLPVASPQTITGTFIRSSYSGRIEGFTITKG